MATPSSSESKGFVANNPGWIGTIFAILVAAGFLGALYQSSQSHHGPAPHGSPASSAPHAPAAH